GLHRLLRPSGYLQPGRVQRLPDAVQPARTDPRQRALAALRTQPLRAVRSPRRHGGSTALAVDLPQWHGRLTHADRHRPRRRLCRVCRQHRRRRLRSQQQRRPALRRQPRPHDRPLPRQPQRLPPRHHRPHHPRRPRHHHDAPPGTRLPRRPELLVPGRLERRRRLDAHVPQCTGLGRLNPPRTNKNPGQAPGFFMHECRAPARMNSLSPGGTSAAQTLTLRICTNKLPLPSRERVGERGKIPPQTPAPPELLQFPQITTNRAAPMKTKILTFTLLLATTACTTPPPTTTHIYKADGNKQCEPATSSLADSTRQLTNAGIEVHNAHCATQTGMAVITVCGAPTLGIHLHEINSFDLQEA